MVSLTVLAVMSYAVDEKKKDVVALVSGLDVFPLELRLNNTTKRVKSKLRLINLSPKMYYKLYQLLR